MNTREPDNLEVPSTARSLLNRPQLHGTLLGIAVFTMASISWRSWPDVQVDYANQLYFPWRISLGEVLYRDLFYIYGPLSQYTHGFLFKLFGVDFMVIAGFNILLIILFTILLYRLFTYLGDATTGILCALTFVTVFAFAQYVGIGNFNFVSSYRHEIAHGAILSVTALVLFNQYMRNHKLIFLAGSGLAVGLTFLTKSEVFTALFLAMIPLAIYILATDKQYPGKASSLFAIFVATAFLPALLFAFYLCFHMPLLEVTSTLTLPLKLTLIPQVRQSPFYKLVMGTDYPLSNLFLMTQYGLFLIFIFMSLLGINHIFQRFGQYRSLLAPSLLVIVLGMSYWLFDWQLMLDAARGLPLLIAPLLFYEGWQLKQSWNKENRERQVLSFMLTLFALLLLGKMILYTRLGHYGFVLSLPATLLLVKVLVFDGNRLAKKLSKSNWAYQSLSIGLMAVFMAGHVYVSQIHYSKKTFAFGNEEEYIYDYDPGITSRGLLLQMTVDFIKENTRQDETLTAFPNSATFNYMARRRNPIKYDNFTPTEQIILGERALIDALEENPPDHILFTAHDHSSFGARTFGRDYAVQVFEWVKKNYTPGNTIGADPFSAPEGFGVQFWKRKRMQGNYQESR